ncbi:hypothetical protein [Halobacteriovorax sp. JY17]|uniref:hypothetical protein n=1 Tax=Halobacteriovorax sp. JY17 TaxID=2014617 RepID=UPI000C617662|nr:hypothetical protein [Halobacteriovorax sp. JY17]PIK14553.1 MAG: hypothetical protein CES88_09425 [Halobacteriovorax sp. JY17]
MNKLRLITFISLITLLESAHACPGCAGSMGNPRDKYLVYILTVFIILCYIPFYFLYKTIIKHRDFNNHIDHAGKAE